MGIVAIIMAIIQGIPALISIIEKIIQLIDNRKGIERDVLQGRFHELLRKHRHCRFASDDDKARCKADMESFLDEISAAPSAPEGHPQA